MAIRMKRSASATWQNGGKEGKGTLKTASGALRDTPYSFHTRFEDQPGTNPEELVAAAHAGCFSMAFGIALEKAGFAPERLDAQAHVTMEQQPGGWTVSRVDLTVEGRVPGIDSQRFGQIAEEAKAGCPISRLLKAEITLEARLQGADTTARAV